MNKEIEIPKGYEARIEGNKVVFIEKESEDERIRGCIGIILTDATEQRFTDFGVPLKDCITWLEKQKPAKWSEEDELNGKDLDAEIKKYTENLYNETFGNGQGTFDEFDWEDISTVIEDTAKHFYSRRPHWKPSEEQLLQLRCAISGCSYDIEPLVSLEDQLRNL